MTESSVWLPNDNRKATKQGPAADADPDRVRQAVRTELTRLLTAHKLDQVTVERAPEPPEHSTGGKYREVIPLN